MSADIDVSQLASWPRCDLVALWPQVMDRPVPARASRSLLVRVLAWQVQAARHGGLSNRAQRQLEGLAASSPQARPTPRLSDGTRLVREWNGRTHIVDVCNSDIVYRGERFASLSAVARHITGARWSGPRFFGLKAAS